MWKDKEPLCQECFDAFQLMKEDEEELPVLPSGHGETHACSGALPDSTLPVQEGEVGWVSGSGHGNIRRDGI